MAFRRAEPRSAALRQCRQRLATRSGIRSSPSPSSSTLEGPISALTARRRFVTSTSVDAWPSSRLDYPRINGGPKWVNKAREGSEATNVAEEGEKIASRKVADQVTASSSGQDGAPEEGASAPSGASSSSDGGSGSEGSSGSSGGGGNKSTSLSKQSVPEVYPQVLALPITRRPLFPGFYKAVVIRNPAVVSAIKEMMKRGQPYLGAFLLKDDDADSDIITDVNSVYPVGVFAQITSTFPAGGSKGKDGRGKDGDAATGEEEGLTAVLYPHRRIRITELMAPRTDKASQAVVHDIQEAARAEGIISEIPEVGGSQVAATENGTEPGADGDSRSSRAPPSFQTSFLQDYAVSLVNVENMEMEPFKKNSQVARAVASEIISVFKDIATLNPLFRDQIANFSMSQGAGNVFEEPDKLADFAAAVSTSPGQGESGSNELQEVLESMVLEERLQKALFVLKQELKNAELQSKITRDVEGRIGKRQREFYLMEQLKGIKKELGLDSDGKDKLVEKFKEKAAALNMPDYVKTVFDEEINKLQTLEPQASEFNVTRNYLDWITSIPWGRRSEENFDLTHATTVLDEDHYGLKDVKDRILEFLAVGKLRGTVEGKILCLVGPPGVGKTSIGKSIARALDRQFYRFSVGGLTDVAEIKGHRRTYVGAMPSKIVMALKKVQTENPLILIDEIDKVGRGHNGDPSSALLEMLDPEQNSSFLDHYMDVPIDLSRVLFVCTANVLDTIPAPLLDRMEVLEVSGYVSEEKMAIASRYLAPQAKESSGLKKADVELAAEAIELLIRYYCRESGVRKLKQQIEKVYRKAALRIVKDLGEEKLPEASAEAAAPADDTSHGKPEHVEKQDGLESSSSGDKERKTTTEVRRPLDVPPEVSIHIDAHNLVDYVGPPIYQKDRLYTGRCPAGVSQGLGYTGNGAGAVMPIEATVMPGSGNITLTGKLGEVIRESAQIGLSFVKTNAYHLGLTDAAGQDLTEKKSIHLHMPEGSIGKEGPSAGIAILTAYLSLFSGIGIRSDLAMTGELTLAGQVLPVGGLKEKILAAHRAGMKKILAPAANKADIEYNVPPSVKEGIDIEYVEDVRQVIKAAFEGTPLVERLGNLPMVPLEEIAAPATNLSAAA